MEVDTDSTHGSQEEATQIELSVNQKDLDGQESMIERTPDVQESPEDLGVKSANTESDRSILMKPVLFHYMWKYRENLFPIVTLTSILMLKHR